MTDGNSAGEPAAELPAVDEVFHALAHATRRHVLLVLNSRGGELTAGEIARCFPCSWPTTTRHLRVLRESGLVRVEQRGRERIYSLDRSRLEVVRGWLAGFDPDPDSGKGGIGADRPGRGPGRRPQGPGRPRQGR